MHVREPTAVSKTKPFSWPNDTEIPPKLRIDHAGWQYSAEAGFPSGKRSLEPVSHLTTFSFGQ